MRASPAAGVLAIQGDYDAHAAALRELGAEVRLVRAAEDLAGLAALVLPGGESTTIAKGLARLGLDRAIADFARAGGALLGTCAGAILLAREVENHPVPALGLVDVVARRNAYGTQVDSFAAPADSGDALAEGLRCVFIRAPRLERPGPAVEVLARVDGAPVWVQQGRIQLTTFHPELTPDRRVHARLLEQAV